MHINAFQYRTYCLLNCAIFLGNKGPELSFDVSFYTSGSIIPSELNGLVTATYTNESGRFVSISQVCCYQMLNGDSNLVFLYSVHQKKTFPP